MIAITPAPAASSALVDHPKSYLVSILNIPLMADDRITGFSIKTWGVTFKTVCHIPPGWTISAGGSATPEGQLAGDASLGVTWLESGSSPEFKKMVLVDLYSPVQRRDVRVQGGTRPATFKGYAHLWNNDVERKVRLTWSNVELTPASRCPAAAP